MTKKSSQSTGDLVLETAARCIAKYGIEKSTTRKIAEMAGVSRGLVPYYVPKRADLLFQVIQFIFRKIKSQATTDIKDLKGAEKILAAFRINFEQFLGQPHYYACFLLSYYYANFDKKFTKLHTAEYRTNCANAIKYLKEEAAEKRLKRSDNSFERKAEELMDLLDGGLLFYSAVEHSLSLKEYTYRKLETLRESIDHFFID